MENENKYYTPTIEEFHVGFEYEFRPIHPNGVISFLRKEFVFNNEWIPDTLGSPRTREELLTYFYDTPNDMTFVEHYIKGNAVRVKCLDREDVEILGWILIHIDTTRGDKETYCMVYDGDVTDWRLERDFTLKENVLIHNAKTNRGFNGTIKNKSELKMILKMIGVC